MSDIVFSIRKLQCAYQNNAPVLFIDKLDISKGNLVFVIGKSGIGKSTFIETLGLMNRTISRSDDCSIQYTPQSKVTAIELKDFWSENNETMSAFRRENFSFIFQSTNLMQNFTAGENMMINLLIEGWEISRARERVVSVMNKLSLSEDLFDRGTAELSGGQRQRLAFVRGITAPFNVLFGDEPTGNLDENTANEVMTSLKDLIIAERKAAIIVSHDLKLALKFADQIVALTPMKWENDHTLGYADPANILKRENGSWYSANAGKIADPEGLLKSYLK
jgi:putative ABC transport system ATP-binding protein